MKKLIVLISVIALVSVAVFAGTDYSTDKNTLTTAETNDLTKVVVKTVIPGKVSAAWRSSTPAAVTSYEDLVGNAADLIFEKDKVSKSVMAYIRSNKTDQTTVTITAKPLMNLVTSEVIAYTPSIESSTGSVTAFASSTNGDYVATWKNSAVDQTASTSSTSALRTEFATVTVTTTNADLFKATAGTYEGALIMAITTL